MKSYIQLFKQAKKAGTELNLLSEKKINELLELIAQKTKKNITKILSENQKDLEKMDPILPKYDRLLLNEQRITDIISDLHKVKSLPYPVGKILAKRKLENGLQLSKISVPFGVIGIIFESRPNVCYDVFSLCLKSGNACILKGGSEAAYSNAIISEIIRSTLKEKNINPDICTLLPNDRSATEQLLTAREYVDLIIPRGGKELINFVRENSLIPVIETGAGVCHTYFHQEGNKEIGKNIITNAKTRKVSVCNSLDCLIIDKYRLPDLAYLCKDLMKQNVLIYADDLAYKNLLNQYPNELLKKVNSKSYGTEFLDYKMSIKTVESVNEAINHINLYGSRHSEAIISENKDAIKIFERRVDAACVYINASTAFTDGSQLGWGAEIGISTQKMHARGPMALEELCTYKWIIQGNGQIRR